MTTEATPGAIGSNDQLGAGSETRCMCKDRALSACPGQWEPGCDLGNNPAHVVAVPRGDAELLHMRDHGQCSLRQIADFYGVSEATASRWVKAARAKFAHNTGNEPPR